MSPLYLESNAKEVASLVTSTFTVEIGISSQYTPRMRHAPSTATVRTATSGSDRSVSMQSNCFCSSVSFSWRPCSGLVCVCVCAQVRSAVLDLLLVVKKLRSIRFFEVVSDGPPGQQQVH